MVAAWALGGLVLSLGPSLAVGVLGNDNHLAGGLPIFIIAGVSAVASVRFRDLHARTTARGGLAALIAGVAVVLIALGPDRRASSWPAPRSPASASVPPSAAPSGR